MNLRKITLVLMIMILTILASGIFNVAYAASVTGETRMLKIEQLRKSGYQYAANEKFVFKIYDDPSSSTRQSYYCLKGGAGFGSSEFKQESRNYTQSFDMKQPNTITAPYTNAIPNVNSSTYKSLLWLLENIYVAPKINASTAEVNAAREYRAKLLKDADIEGITSEVSTDSELDDLIDVVQQYAIWYFTNSDIYHVESLPAIWRNPSQGTYVSHPNNCTSIDDLYDSFDLSDYLSDLFDYFVTTARQKGSTYQITTASKPYELDKLMMLDTIVGQNHIIGPFKIKKLSDTPSTLTATFKNGNTVITPKMQNQDGTVTYSTIQETIGKEFYISIPKTTQLDTISLEISGSYYNTNITYWSVENAPNTEQPVVEVTRTKEPYSDSTTYTPVERTFDLALRKFITKINDVAQTPSREPVISSAEIQALKNGGNTYTTANKVHPKNALTVKTNDKVTYTIRVYNEGELDGYVKEITDYLPAGLKLATNSTINTQYGWRQGANGKVTTDITSPNTTNSANRDRIYASRTTGSDKVLLKAFDGTRLDYIDVQIECEVIATSQNNYNALKNIAEITNAEDINGNPKDRDSTPNNVNKDNYGTTSQEDDDDFEQLILEDKKFDLALRKFITSINNVAPNPSREPVISSAEIQALKNGGDTYTTANKVHPKNALTVKTNDKVIYTIRVYNEGEVDGYVKEITDYLPAGLKLADGSTLNTQYGWKQGANGEITTDITSPDTTNSTNRDTIYANRRTGSDKVLLKAFDGTTLDYIDVQIECEVIATTESNYNALKNVAEITKQTDKDGKPVTDRDSDPDNVDKDNYGTTSQEDDDDFEQLILENKRFDLALRKFITSINNVAPNPSRVPVISNAEIEKLKNGGDNYTTASKVHPKNALEVNTSDKVIYTIRVYNEGEVDGYVKEITDYLPAGLKLVDGSTLNAEYGWKQGEDGKVTTDITSPDTTNAANRDRIYASRRTENDKVLLKAFDGTTLDYIDVQIECEVIATVQNKDNILKNIAEITKQTDKDGNEIKDRDSDPNNVDKDKYGTTSQEDDDDFEQLVLSGKYFDLALRKFITGVKNDKNLVDENGKFIREPVVDVKPLIDGKDTAIYKHPKVPVSVDVGEIVTYTIRVYNEGQIDGYVNEITDHLPQWLEFVNNEFNASYGWKVSEDGRTVTTDITSPNTENSANRDLIYAQRREESDKVLLKAFNKETKELDYIDVRIQCKVKDTGTAEKITNIAQITKQSDKSGNVVPDRDSTPNNKTLPKDEVLPDYRDNEINRGDEYIPGDEDDDDFEKVIIQKFDLALRKFITNVNKQAITTRIPVFSKDKDGNFKYTHPKTPVEVVNGDIVIYTLRIYNEGNQAGYAEEVKDNLPEGLEYLPEHDLNKGYRWKMYKEDGTETQNVKEAKTIRTDYLSKAQETETKRDNLLKAFDQKTMTQPDYRDVKVAFKVTEPNTSDRILINTAEISEDADEEGNPVEDIDSVPDNDKEKEDDIDIEKVKVKYFDLALEKIVTEYSITRDGKTTKTKTGHKFGVHPEPVAKVEIIEETIKRGTVKFKYQIKVTNEGEIEGYATEIKDYIPEGLKFVEKDNKKWKLSKDGKTVTTDQLKDKLLKPGESAVVEITLQWINGSKNLGLKQNWAEISKDKNDSDTPDIDSTPDNNKKGEDDIDDAKVILSVVTGIGESYIGIIAGVLVILAGGILLIKKFVM